MPYFTACRPLPTEAWDVAMVSWGHRAQLLPDRARHCVAICSPQCLACIRHTRAAVSIKMILTVMSLQEHLRLKGQHTVPTAVAGSWD